jgi:hypothetical protein
MKAEQRNRRFHSRDEWTIIQFLWKRIPINIARRMEQLFDAGALAIDLSSDLSRIMGIDWPYDAIFRRLEQELFEATPRSNNEVKLND